MLLRVPQSWSPVTVAAVAMILLAALDLAGAYTAKEAVVRRSPAFALAGGFLFLLLFWVYCSSLQYAELAPVTFGWIVVLQVGVVLLDRFHYRTAVPTGHWIAMGLILAAQAYLLLAPAGTQRTTAQPAPPATERSARPAATAAADPERRTVTLPAPRAPEAHHGTARHGRH